MDISPIISPSEAKKLFGQHDVIWVDARGGTDAYARYQQGHVRGAIFMDLESDLSNPRNDASKGGRHPLPDPKEFGSLLGRRGITSQHHIVVYDDRSGANAAARFWWMIKAVGHDRIQVVNGGLNALREAGVETADGPGQPIVPQLPYPVQNWALPVADIEAVDYARKSSKYIVIDVRESYRYDGVSEPIDLVAGHIPGAVNIPFTQNLNERGAFHSPEDLATKYKSILEARSEENVIVHCGSGVTACHTLLAMATAGLPIPRLYVGSWSEWSRNNKPIATAQDP